MHTAKKKQELQKRKSPNQFLTAADKPPPKQHQDFINSKSDAFKKGTVRKRSHPPHQRP
jgi:hypothetical protein